MTARRQLPWQLEVATAGGLNSARAFLAAAKQGRRVHPPPADDPDADGELLPHRCDASRCKGERGQDTAEHPWRHDSSGIKQQGRQHVGDEVSREEFKGLGFRGLKAFTELGGSQKAEIALLLRGHCVLQAAAVSERRQGNRRHQKMQPLYEEVVAARTANLGPSHNDTLAAKNNLANLRSDLGGEAMYALTAVRGIGRRISNIVCEKCDIDPKKRAGELTTADVNKIVAVISGALQFKIPSGMLTRQRCVQDGKTSQKYANFLDQSLREDLERMRCLRHYLGIRVRGQHTKTTGRHRDGGDILDGKK